MPLRLLAFSLLLLLWRPLYAASPITVCIDENAWAPYTYWEGAGKSPVYKGFTVELASRLLQDLGQSFRIRRLPWPEVHKRAQSASAGERCDMVWDISATPAREAYLDFTDPIYRLRYNLVFNPSRFPNGAPLHQINELKQWQACGVEGYNYGNLLPDLALTRYPSIEAALDAVRTQSCDFFLIEAAVLAKGQSLGFYVPSKFDCIDLEGFSKGYRLAVSKQAEHGATLIAGLRKGVESARRNGLSSGLAEKYRLPAISCRQKIE